MKKALRKMLAVLMALTMIVANFAIIAVNAEDDHAHAEEVVCPGEGKKHDKSNCTWTKGKTVAPVCDTDGYTLYTCNGCKAPFLADIINASESNHVPGEPVVVEEGDCTHPSYVQVYCTICKVALGDKTEVAAPGHEMVEDGEGCKCANCDEVTHAEHNFVIDEITKLPTKDSRGEAKFHCTYCGKEVINDHVSKLCDETHEWVYVRGQDATCQQEGFFGYIECKTCGEAFCKVVDPKKDHTWDEGVQKKAPTCTTKGEKLFTCTACKVATKTEEVATIEHNGIVPEDGHRDPSCVEEGWDIYVCTMCLEVVKEVIFPKTEHDYDYNNDGKVDEDDIAAGKAAGLVTVVDPTCTTDGSITYKCQYTLCRTTNDLGTKVVTLTKLGHDEKEIAADPATCLEPGTTAGSYCDRCKEVLVAPKDVDALGHDFQLVTDPATCMTFSKTYKACSRCKLVDEEFDPVFGEQVDPDGHVLGYEIQKAPTCLEEGVLKVWCELCHRTDLPDQAIPATGHNFKGEVTTKPTCTEKGWTTYTCQNENCDGCTAELSDTHKAHTDACHQYTAQDVDALGHTWGDITKEDQFVTVPETCIKDGYTAALCIVCGAEAKATDGEANYKVIPANPDKFHVHNEDFLFDGGHKDGGIVRKGNCVVLALYRYKCDVCHLVYLLTADEYGDCEKPELVDVKDYDKLFCNAKELIEAGMVIAYCPACGAYHKVTGAGTSEQNPEIIYERIYTDEETLPTGKTVTLVLHDYKDYDGDEYNCLNNGWDAYKECTKCKDTTKKPYNANGHDFFKTVKVGEKEVLVDVIEPEWIEFEDEDDYVKVEEPNENNKYITKTVQTRGERCINIFCNEDHIQVSYVERYHIVETYEYYETGYWTEEKPVYETVDITEERLNVIGTADAKCDAAGYTLVACEECGQVIIIDVVLPLGHTYGNITGIFSCQDERLLEAMEGEFYAAVKCDVCNGDIHDKLTPMAKVEACDGIYTTSHCVGCGYTYAELDYAFPVNKHDVEGFDYKLYAIDGTVTLKTPATATSGNVYEATCRYCGETITWNDGKVVDELEFTYDIFYADENLEINKDLTVTNNGYLALVIKTTSPGVEVNSIGLKLNYDATRLTFVSGSVVNENFSASNSIVYGNDKATGATLTVLAVTEDGNIGLTGSNETLAVVYFYVNTLEDDDTNVAKNALFAVNAAASEVLNDKDANIAANFGTGASVELDKLGDINGDNRLSLVDLNRLAIMIDLDYEGDYYSYADINCDGSVDFLDYELLVDYYLEKITYVEMCA